VSNIEIVAVLLGLLELLRIMMLMI